MKTDIKKKYELIHNPSVEGANADVVVCRRVADMPIPGAPAEIQRCSYCDERIWVALSSPKKPLRACWQCVGAKFADQDQTYLVTQRHLDREIKHRTLK
jgi:hypothetical protein